MITQFLAAVIGWYFLIMGIYLLCNQEHVKSVMADIIANRGLYFLVAIITLIIGLMMVISHNVWVMGWPVVITIISWLTLIAGIIRLFCSKTTMKMWQSFTSSPEKMRVVSIVAIIIGLFLLYKVYFSGIAWVLATMVV